MAIKNTVFIGILSAFLDSIGVYDCRLPGVIMQGGGNAMPDLSDRIQFIQYKLKISIYLSLDKYKCIKLIQFCNSYFD